tara:strand:+ start:147 stop:320 length:174 start_codon:yes stop_codon:yes gene_type:complete
MLDNITGSGVNLVNAKGISPEYPSDWLGLTMAIATKALEDARGASEKFWFTADMKHS